jgi:hypothetical protein
MTSHPEPVPSDTCNLRPDGTVFPPVTPDPPPPPGYVSPLDGPLESPVVDDVVSDVSQLAVGVLTDPA